MMHWPIACEGVIVFCLLAYFIIRLALQESRKRR